MTEFIFPIYHQPGSTPPGLSAHQQQRFEFGLPYQGKHPACVHFMMYTGAQLDMHMPEPEGPYEVAAIASGSNSYPIKNLALRTFIETIGKTLVYTGNKKGEEIIRGMEMEIREEFNHGNLQGTAIAIGDTLMRLPPHPDKRTGAIPTSVQCFYFPAIGAKGASRGLETDITIKLRGLSFSPRVIEAYHSFKKSADPNATTSETAHGARTVSPANWQKVGPGKHGPH